MKHIRTPGIKWLHLTEVGTPPGLQASAPFFPSLTPPILFFILLMLCSASPCPTHTHQSLIHFSSSGLCVPWFICLWSLLTLSNTFLLFPSSPSSPALFRQSPWVRWGISMTFFSSPLLWSQLFTSSLSPALRKVKIQVFFPPRILIWSPSKTLLMSKGVLAFPSRNSLFIINNIFSSSDVSWFEMFAPASRNAGVVTDTSRAVRGATLINREPCSWHTKLHVSFRSQPKSIVFFCIARSCCQSWSWLSHRLTLSLSG